MCDGVRDAFPVDSQFSRNSYRKQIGVHEMDTGHFRLHSNGLALGPHNKGRALERARLYLGGAIVAVVAEADKERPCNTARLRHDSGPLIVAIENRQTIDRQRGYQLALCTGYSFD